MTSVMKTLLLNPPSFEKFDGGASSRWPATREIESYWYPVWIAYATGMLPGSRLLDAPPQHIGKEETIKIAKDYEFVVIFTSTVGFRSDVGMARAMKAQNPDVKVCFVGPHVQIKPVESLMENGEIDFIVRGEFDHAVVEFAQGMPLAQIRNASYVKDGKVVHNETRPQLHTEGLDALPFATEVYAKHLKIENYNVPFLLHPYVSYYTTRGCPALCTFCLWPQTLSGHAWRVRSTDNVAREFEGTFKLFPQAKEVFFDDDTFNIRKDRVIDLCKKIQHVGRRWSCTARVHADYETLKVMGDAGARLLIVGFESGDGQILKNIKKGATVEMARNFMKNAKKAGITVHGDFIIGLPGETPETIQKTIEFAKELDCESIQVSLAHAYPGTELYNTAGQDNFLHGEAIADDGGHQLPHLEYPGLTREMMMSEVHRFYDEYYFRPRVAWRFVRERLWNAEDRRILYHEAVDFLRLRAQRRKMARKGIDKKKIVAVPSLEPATSSATGNEAHRA
jgi:hopanoid biosynthesis associated radical SAM protein HpnJ